MWIIGLHFWIKKICSTTSAARMPCFVFKGKQKKRFYCPSNHEKQRKNLVDLNIVNRMLFAIHHCNVMFYVCDCLSSSPGLYKCDGECECSSTFCWFCFSFFSSFYFIFKNFKEMNIHIVYGGILYYYLRCCIHTQTHFA